MEFAGAKAALFCGPFILTYLRDDRPGLAWSGHWDLPGGGREGEEGAEACLLRELQEEFGLALSADRLIWRRSFPAMADASRTAIFFAGWLTAPEIAEVRFGDEGHRWEMMPLAAFLSHDKVVPELRRRVGIVCADPAFAATGFPETR